MMSGEVMTFSVGSLLELQVMVAERTKVSVEFLQLLQGQQVLCDVDLKSLKSLGNGGEIAELSCIICPSVPLIIKLLKKEDFHFRGLNETATKTACQRAGGKAGASALPAGGRRLQWHQQLFRPGVSKRSQYLVTSLFVSFCIYQILYISLYNLYYYDYILLIFLPM
jgi:hypothetical protein